MMFEFLTIYLAEFTYGGIFLVLLLCGMGLPIPEDIPILLSGYLSYTGTINIWAALGVNLIGILIGDLFIYGFGYWMGPRALNHPLIGRVVTPGRHERVASFFTRHGKKAIFFGRFVAGLRAPLFLAAGITRLPLRTFILMDFSAALISVPLLLFLAYTFGEEIDRIKTWVGTTQRTLWVVVALAVLWFVARALFNRRKRRGAAQEG